MKKGYLLILILIGTAILNLWGLSRGDTINDEVFMSFRSIGMMDFDEAQMQTTPLEWWDPNIPSWTKLSFHDHPPLVFLVQHIFMKIFGENNFAFRLPSALLGIASVYLIYLIGVILYSQNIGVISAILFGLTLNHIYISRTGMQEPYVIFFLLLSTFYFLLSLKKDKYLIWAGIILGLGFLTKITTFILVPIFLTYLLFFKRNYLLNKKLWLGACLALLIFSPVIVYNIMLYRAVGHFDFQFSYIFDQNPEVWEVAPGKEIGTLTDRLNNFIPRLIATNSWLFLTLVVISAIAFIKTLLKNPKETLQKNAYLLLTTFYLLLLILKIGPSYRFLTMLTPFLALISAIFINYLYQIISPRYIKIVCLFFAVIIAFEIFYSINNQIIYYPKGPIPWLSSKVRFENYNWGYNELGKFIESELSGKMPALTFDPKYQFLNKLRETALQKGQQQGLEVYPALFIYDGNFDKGAKLWVLDRLHIYHAWPIINLKTYYEYLSENGFDYYDQVGFKYFYFIFQNNIVPSQAAKSLMRGIPLIIQNRRGDKVFEIYKFNSIY